MPRKPTAPEAHPLETEMDQVSGEVCQLRRMINETQESVRKLEERQAAAPGQPAGLTDAVHDAANQLMLLTEIGEGIKGILERIAIALEATPDRLEAIAENLDKIWDDFGWALQNDKFRNPKEEWHLAEDAKAMGLTGEDIAQAKAEGVETPLGLRRIEKNNRQKKKEPDSGKLFT